MKIDTETLDWVERERKKVDGLSIENAKECLEYNMDSPRYRSIRQEYHRNRGKYAAFSDMLKKFAEVGE